MNLENGLRVSISSMSFSFFNAIRLFFFRSLFSSTCRVQSDASLGYFCILSLSFALSIRCVTQQGEEGSWRLFVGMEAAHVILEVLSPRERWLQATFAGRMRAEQ